MARVFVSYRRSDARYPARLIYDALRSHLSSDDIFMDVDSIPPGVDFVEHIADRVEACQVFLCLIGSGWLEAGDEQSGGRRLDDPDDVVRIEIRSALRRDIRVVPVLLDGVSMPDEEQLPEDLKGLVRRNGEHVHLRTFEADVERLFRKLKLTEASRQHHPLLWAAGLVALVSIGGLGLWAAGQDFLPSDPDLPVPADSTGLLPQPGAIGTPLDTGRLNRGVNGDDTVAGPNQPLEASIENPNTEGSGVTSPAPVDYSDAPVDTKPPAPVGTKMREVQYVVRYAEGVADRAAPVIDLLESNELQVDEVVLYSIPATVANRIFYPEEYVDVARWIQTELEEGAVALALSSFEASGSPARAEIRIIVGTP